MLVKFFLVCLLFVSPFVEAATLNFSWNINYTDTQGNAKSQSDVAYSTIKCGEVSGQYITAAPWTQVVNNDAQGLPVTSTVTTWDTSSITRLYCVVTVSNYVVDNLGQQTILESAPSVETSVDPNVPTFPNTSLPLVPASSFTINIL